MAFPLDPNAPDGPNRSEYLRLSHATEADLSIRLATLEQQEPVVLAEVGGKPVAALGLRAGDATVADPARASAGVMALLHLHRLETLVIAAVFGI
jgi:hypothetical protein